MREKDNALGLRQTEINEHTITMSSGVDIFSGQTSY